MITSQPHELTWGSFTLASEVPPDVPWLCETMASDASLGEPVPVVETIESQLVDGSLSVTTSYGNREVTWEVRISADDGRGLAQAEAALMAEVTAEHPAPLHWTPPALDAWTCVFDVVTARLSPKYDPDWDLEEKRRISRYYTLTFECLPWAHDPEETVVPALPIPVDPDVPPTVIVVDNCESATGWTRSVTPATGWWTSLTGPSTGSSSVRVTGVTKGSTWGTGWTSSLSLERSGFVSTEDTPYLVVTAFLSPESATNPRPNVVVTYNGSAQPHSPVAMRRVPGADPNIYDVFFDAPPVSFTKVKVTTRFAEPKNTFKALFIYDVSRTDRISTGATGFEVSRTAVIGGSAPTQAAITVAAEEAATLLERTGFVYTGTSAGISLRPLIHTSAAPLDDTTLVSGSSNNLSVASTFLVPVNLLAEANYSLLARLKHSGSITVSWSAKVVSSSGTTIPGSEIVESGSMLVTNPGAEGWMLHELGDIPMPVVSIEGETTHCVKVEISMASGGASVELDNAWLLDTENGAVTTFQQSTAYSLNAVELRSPQLDAPRQSVIGTWVTYGSQDVTTRVVRRLGTHLIRPGTLFVLTMMDKQKYAPTSLRFYKRYGTYPGPGMDDSESS